MPFIRFVSFTELPIDCSKLCFFSLECMRFLSFLVLGWLSVFTPMYKVSCVLSGLTLRFSVDKEKADSRRLIHAAAKMTPLSAVQLYKLLAAISDSFHSYHAFEQQILRAMATPRYKPNTHELIAEQCAKALESDPAKQQLAPFLQQTLRDAQSDAGYDAALVRLVESFTMIRKVEQQLANDTELQRFVASLRLDDANAQHEQVMASLNAFLSSLDDTMCQRVTSILQEQRDGDDEFHQQHQQQTEDDVDDEDDDELLLFQVYEILRDDELFLQFKAILEQDVAANVPWKDTLIKLYTLVNSARPDAWDALSNVLDQIEAAQGEYYVAQHHPSVPALLH